MMKKADVAKVILRTIGAAGLFTALLIAPGLSQGIAIIHKITGRDKKTIKSSLYYLQRKKFVSFKKEGGAYKMILTTSGLKLLKKYSFDDINFSQKKKWDGFWRIITFDIPERKAGARKAISSKLRALGCFPLQKSIFVYPYDCRKEVDFIGNYFEARDNICMIEANHIDGEDQIRKYFKL